MPEPGSARHLGRRWLGPAFALGVLILVLGIGWAASSSLEPGVYLARFSASQVVVQRLVGISVPVLWVPAWPWEESPSFASASIDLADGSRLRLGTGEPSWDGHGANRRGYVPCFFVEAPTAGMSGVSAGAGVPCLQSPAARVVLGAGPQALACSGKGLWVVRPTIPLSDGRELTGVLSATFGIERETLLLYLETQASSIKLADIVLPPEAYPLAYVGPDGLEKPVTFPLTLEKGTTQIITAISGGISTGNVLLMPVLDIRLDGRDIWYCPFATCFRFSTATLRTAYDVPET